MESKLGSKDGARGTLNGPREVFETDRTRNNSLLSYYLEDVHVIHSVPSELLLLSTKKVYSSIELEDEETGISLQGCKSYCANMIML